MENITCELKTVTPEMALKLLANCPYEHQRKLRPRLVARYARDMQAGNWNPGSVLELVECKDDLYLVNGQHRLHAVVESGKEQCFVMKMERVATPKEVAHRYYTIDTGGARSFSELVNATEIREKTGLSSHQLNAVKAAARFILGGFDKSDEEYSKTVLSPDESLVLVNYWTETALEYYDTISGRNGPLLKRMRNAGVVGVALVTFKYQCTHARKFWAAVASNDGLKPGQPEHALVSFLYEKSFYKLGGNLYARYVANCWSAYFENREIKKLAVRDANNNINIEGSPFLYSRQVKGLGLIKE
jgi:hypothetical protein